MERVTMTFVEPEVGVGATASAPVVIATDGSTRSDAAVHLGHVLAERDDALRIITVATPPAAYSEAQLLVMADLDAARRAEARSRVIKQLERTLPDRCDVELLEGDPAASVAQLAHASRASLIVCGLGRHRAVDRVFGDETALRLVRHADVPIYAVAADAAGVPKCVVAAIDFSGTSIRAARLAVDVAAPGATIYLVHVASRDVAPDEQDQHDGDGRGDRENLGVALQRVRDHLRIPGDMTVQTVILRGTPADELLTLARIVGADLVATGTHGRGFVARVLVGSVATQILRGASCSVLTVPPSAVATKARSDDVEEESGRHLETPL